MPISARSKLRAIGIVAAIPTGACHPDADRLEQVCLDFIDKIVGDGVRGDINKPAAGAAKSTGEEIQIAGLDFPVPAPAFSEVVELHKRGRIAAIKAYRARTGLNFRDARSAIAEAEKVVRPETPRFANLSAAAAGLASLTKSLCIQVEQVRKSSGTCPSLYEVNLLIEARQAMAAVHAYTNGESND